MTDDPVLTAIRVALNESPNDRSLLVHFIKLCTERSLWQEGLEYAQRLLTQSPTDVEALALAIQCAENAQSFELAKRYQQILSSLDNSSPTAADKSDKAVHNIQHQNNPIHMKSGGGPAQRGGKATLRLVGKDDDSTFITDIEESRISLVDVAGMENVKKRLQLSFLAPLKNPELMQAYGKSVRGGLLLYGPPGCGKTYIARALAGELGAKFMSIGLNDILDMYVGESERKLHDLFEEARRNSPVVLFIDEIDALGQKRSQLRNSGMRTLVNQLLAEMDSINSENDNLFVLAATNHPWDVDTALRRPGRFDRVVAVFPPDEVARESMLEYYLKDKPTENINPALLAKNTTFFSGADLSHICTSAAELAMEQSIESGKIQPITQRHLENALQETRPSTLAWFETARNHAMFANEHGAYDDLLDYIQRHKL